MILIIDDDIAVRTSLSLILNKKGYETQAVSTPDEALDIVRHTTPQLILMDMNYSLTTTGEEGLELLQKVRIFQKHTPIILITAWGSIDLAVKGMQAGANDFITKPWNNLVLMQRIETQININSAARPLSHLGGEGDEGHEADWFKIPEGIIGKSKGLLDALETAKRICRTNASVLITGESGTGKELIAECIHRNSLREGKPFVKVNLGGISQSLFESEMFGHKRGAFTDAIKDREGRFAMADGGTIFLDEIGDLDLSCQVKLLRVLQEQQYEMLGDSRTRTADVRVISATNADLKQMVADHTFREDLFFRINLITINLPPLRERRDDIPLLVRHFADEVTTHNKMPRHHFSPEAMERFKSLPYPGNIRELKNLVERTVLLGEDMPETTSLSYSQSSSCINSISTLDGDDSVSLSDKEKETISRVLAANGGNVSMAAKQLGISRQALYRRIDKYGL